MIPQTETIILIFTILCLFLQIFTLLIIVGRTSTVIQQITDFDSNIAEIFLRLDPLLEKFNVNGGALEPINPIQAVIGQFLAAQLEKNQTMTNRNDLGQFKSLTEGKKENSE